MSSSEHLLNMAEACQYLGVDEHKLKTLVRKKIIPAYRIGGSFLRFRIDQLSVVKDAIRESPGQDAEHVRRFETSRVERIKDFLYFNDFYIVSAVLVVLAVVAIFAS